MHPHGPAPTSAMNITPMIDVLLVLLVIFMAALPISRQGLDVSLPPQTDSTLPPPPGDSKIVLDVDATRAITVNRQAVAQGDLGTFLTEVFSTRRDKTLFVSGAPTLAYEDVLSLIDIAKGAGVGRIGVITPGMRRVYVPR